MIASKPYVFPPRIMLTSLEIVRVLIIIVSQPLSPCLMLSGTVYEEITVIIHPCFLSSLLRDVLSVFHVSLRLLLPLYLHLPHPLLFVPCDEQ